MKQDIPPPASPGAAGPISYRRLLHWSLVVVDGARRLFILSLAAGIASQLTGMYSVILVAQIISDLGMPPEAGDPVTRLVAICVIWSLASIGLTYYYRMLTISANSMMLGALQQRLHDQLLRMPTAFHERYELGETTTIVMQDAAGCQPMLAQLLSSPLTQGITLLAALGILFDSLKDLQGAPVLAMVLLAAALVGRPIIGWKLSKRPRDAFAEARTARSAMALEFNNSASAPLEVRLLGAEAQRSSAFARSMKPFIKLQNKAATQNEVANQFLMAATSLIQLVFLVISALVAREAGALAAAAVLKIYWFVPKITDPMDQIVRFFGGIQTIWVQAARLGGVLDTPPAPPPSGPPAVLDAAPDIIFDDVEFRYPGAPAATLQGLSHVFPAGRISAIVGRSGSGKSSLLGLISGLRQAERGTISIGPYRVGALDEAALRGMVAVVSQSPLFINDTIRANFLLARADATDAEIEVAARQAGLWPALEKLGAARPLDVMVTRVPGQGLSGGERRLLAVARILLCRPCVLLLDEPTTGVDPMTIQVLLGALRDCCAGMTVIMVEHNLDFVASLADEVCCLQNGAFADVGPPGALAARPSMFQELLGARARLTSTAGMDLRSVKPPSIAAGPATDPWAAPPPESAPAPRLKKPALSEVNSA
jgi:ABC-type multidrug transport system fused ATPase/permease subunit